MNLRTLYHLLKEEYRISRHLFWEDDDTGKITNDVTCSLRLIVKAAQGLRCGDETAWEQLVRYAIDRAMSACLMIAIDEYLRPCGEFPRLPIICLEEDKPYRNWQGGVVPLLDESDSLHVSAKQEHPEFDRPLALKGEHQWSLQAPRLTAINPHFAKKNETKSTHWLFA